MIISAAVAKGVSSVAQGLKTPLSLADDAIIQHPFSGGASHLTTQKGLDKFPLSKTYGGSNGLYVAPTNQIDDLLMRAGSRSDLEIALGLGAGSLDNGSSLYKIDIDNPFDKNMRLPDPSTGNEFHRAGTGLTTGNINEQVIDSPLKTSPDIKKTEITGL